MKRTRLVLAVVLGALPIAVVVALWTTKTRTDSVKIVAIDDGYEIEIRSAGRYLAPFTPEGPFPQWGQTTRFLAQGSGERDEIDGVIYKKYSLGKNLETAYLANTFRTCTVHISEAASRLTVDGELSEERKYLINHSGKYDGLDIDHPVIVPLLPHHTAEDIDQRYVRVRGYASDGTLETVNKTFRVNLWEAGEYEVVGLVHSREGELPFLWVCSYKKIATP